MNICISNEAFKSTSEQSMPDSKKLILLASMVCICPSFHSRSSSDNQNQLDPKISFAVQQSLMPFKIRNANKTTIQKLGPGAKVAQLSASKSFTPKGNILNEKIKKTNLTEFINIGQCFNLNIKYVDFHLS